MASEGGRASEGNAMGAAVVDEQIKGITEANTLLIKASEKFRDHVDKFGNVITQISKAETLLGGGNNAVGSAVGAVGGLLGAGFAAKMFKGLFGSKVGKVAKAGFGKKAAIGAAIAASIYGIQAMMTIMTIMKNPKTKVTVVEMYTALVETLVLQEALLFRYQEVQEFQVRLAK
jgi:hypothetical protein